MRQAVAFSEGSIIAGKYKVIEELGRGGMGVVYKAEDLTLKRTVAIKFLSPDLLGDADHRARFLREARMASALNNPHICTIYEVGDEEGTPYIAMENVTGRPLSETPRPESERGKDVVRLGSQIAGALDYAHGQGIIHRDLKASNVMVTPEGRVKILDFGLAKRFAFPGPAEAELSRETITRTGSFLGTIHYAAPEVLRGGPADARSDIWALGVLLYELAVGSLPFSGRTGFELTSAILRDNPAPLPQRVPNELHAIVLRCLEKDPEKRFQKASEIKEALEAIAEGGAKGKTAGSFSKGQHWMRNALLFGAAAVIVLLAVWMLAVRKTQQPGERETGAFLSTGAQPSLIPEANEYFEKGMMFFMHQFDLPRARTMLERALEFDPKFAEARAWYGFSFILEIDAGFSNDSGYLYRAEEEIRRALGDDPDSARVHSSLAALYFYQGRKELVFDEAKKALAINPRDLDAKIWQGNALWAQGKSTEAKGLFEEILKQDPLFFPARMSLGEILCTENDFSGAIGEQEKILEQDPQNIYAVIKMVRALIDMNDLSRARLRLAGLLPKERRNYELDMTWALLLALEGKKAEAEKKMDEECLKYAALAVWSTLIPAEYYSAMGETQKALDWLEKAVRNGDERDDWFRRDPLLGTIRGLPRFHQIVGSIAFQRQRHSSPNGR